MDIDAVEQRTADLCQVALNNGWRAAALPRCIAVEAARAPVQTSIALWNGFIGHHAATRLRMAEMQRIQYGPTWTKE